MANRGHLHGKTSRWIEILGEYDIEHRRQLSSDWESNEFWGDSVNRTFGKHHSACRQTTWKMLIVNSGKLDIRHWELESWYSEIISTLLRGLSGVEDGRRRMMKRLVLRYRIFDDALHYLENGSSGTSWHKDVVGTYVSSLIYRLARTRRSPGKGSTTEIGSRARGTCVEPLAHGSAHHQRQPQQQEPPSKHPGIFEKQPDEQTSSDDERVARELNLALVDAREELRESIQNRANNLTQPVVPRTYRRLRVGTIVWEKHDKAATLKTKSHKSWGNLSRATEQVSEVVYMTTSLVAPGKARKVHVDDLKLYVRCLARLEPPKVIELELDADKEDQRQMLEDPTWDNPEIIDSLQTCEYAGRRRSHHSVRLLSTLRATDWYRQMDTGGSGGGNDGAEELGIM
ncbi:unnamed protein product [Fusarium fujikuroi]|nr:uncharacterized protein FFFS_15743 [Fusarium fujikuroi]VTT60862.1 unnamed protein product [Fusarium fujikuroi]